MEQKTVDKLVNIARRAAQGKGKKGAFSKVPKQRGHMLMKEVIAINPMPGISKIVAQFYKHKGQKNWKFDTMETYFQD